MANRRRDRSRSPVKGEKSKRRSDSMNMQQQQMDYGKMTEMNNQMNNINPMMMNMYQPGNVLMSSMYPNMMMPSSMMGSAMMQTHNMDLMTGTGMEMMQQQPMDMMQQQPMTQMNAQSMSTPNSSSMDVNMMGGMMMDPSMMGMGMYQNVQGMSAEMAVMPEKTEIVLKHCKLIPPEPGTTSPPKRGRPPGCKTIFVGGLPDKIRESIVRDVFERYGRIQTLRLSKKNFCHIRFERETSVDAAIVLTGYHIKLLDKDKKKEKDKDKEDADDDDHGYNGWLHVDYALSRDDQNEYERKQRHTLRFQQAQMQQLTAQQGLVLEQNQPHHRHSRDDSVMSRHRSVSPVRLQPFSNTALIQLSEKIKTEDMFANTLPILLNWLERGECSKRNSTQFYSMIQTTNSHIRRLYNEKVQAEEELVEFKEKVKQRIASVIEQLEQVSKVLNAATHQRVWDHFTKPQRKNIETWQMMTQEFNNIKEEFQEKFNEDNSDYGNGYNVIIPSNNEDMKMLKHENDSLKFQLEAYKNEVEVIKAEKTSEMEKFKAQFIARQALQGSLDVCKPPLPPPLPPPPKPPAMDPDQDTKVSVIETVAIGEAKLIGIMSAFLQVHPQGASLDYVVSYVKALFPQTSQATIHQTLEKHLDAFELTTSGVGANIEKRWSFIAFK